MTLIEKLVLNEKITNEEVEEELYKICDRICYNCTNECLVHKLNNNSIVKINDDKIFKNLGDRIFKGRSSICDCLRDGHKMRMFIIFKNRENKKNLIESEK